jgi:hypothetical protein
MRIDRDFAMNLYHLHTFGLNRKDHALSARHLSINTTDDSFAYFQPPQGFQKGKYNRFVIH